MSDAVFPALPGLTWNVGKVPQFSSIVQRSVGGREVRASLQSYPIWNWTLSYEFLREGTDTAGAALTEFRTLAGFYSARLGRYDSFLYDDPSDDTVSDSAPQNFGTGDGSTTGFQLSRYLSGTYTLKEPIYNLRGAAPKIYVDGVLKTVAVDYNISATGVVVFTSAPANTKPLTWSGGYYWRVRFGDDSATFENFASLFWRNRKVSLVSLLGV